MNKTRITGITFRMTFFLVGLFLTSSIKPSPAQDYDILILNGRVLDGSGSPDFKADVGIRGDHIVAVGALNNSTAKRTIDANGLFIHLLQSRIDNNSFFHAFETFGHMKNAKVLRILVLRPNSLHPQC